MGSRVRIDPREARRQRQLTLREVSEALGLPLTTYARAEQPGSNPRVLTAQRIASFYGVTVDDIWPIEERRP